jgi:septum formation protein
VKPLSPFKTTARLILASASPRRRSLLQDLGLDFEVMESNVVEKPLLGETPQHFVLRAACDKAGAVSAGNTEAWVVGADTVVVCGNKILGKPRDARQAAEMLQSLSGCSHIVHTGFCLQNKKQGVIVSRVVTTEVFFSSFSGEITAAYVATGEPLDKAGAYGIQGCGGFLVEKINGSYSNVVGLPLAEIVEELQCHQVITPERV